MRTICNGVFSYFSEWMARGERGKVKEVIGKVILYGSFLIIPMSVILVLSAEPLIRIFFERGAFSSSDTLAVSKVFKAYVPVIYFNILNMIIGRCISAARKNEAFLVLDTSYLFLRILLNLIFIKLFGLVGISISAALASLMLFIGSYLYINREKSILGV